MVSASFGVLSQNTGFYPSLDRIIETMLGPLNLGPGGGSYNEPISRLQRLCSRIHRRYPNLFGLRRPAPGPHMRSAQTPSGSWTICKPQEVQLPHRYGRVPRVHTDSNRTPHGPGEGSRDPELARTTKCP